MKLQNPLPLFLLLIVVLAASCASQRYVKKASKFEEVGLYEDAAEYYYEAVKKKASNVDAKLGLRKTGQQTLDKKLDAIKKAYKQSDFEDVVYYYLAAESYSDKLHFVGVDLSFPEVYESYYDVAKNDFLNDLYSEGLDKLKREEFKAAQKIFKEIINVEQNYKDAAEKYSQAKLEPVYRQANAYYENEMYRSAYYAYDQIIREKAQYKQALSLKNEAREKATINILVNDFKFSHQSYMQTAKLVTSGIKSQLIELNNPFVNLIDGASVWDRIYKNGKLDLAAARLLGIQAILNGSVLNIKKNNGKLIKETKRGYLKERRKTVDKEGKTVYVTDYKKTEYNQFQLKNTADLHLDFNLVSTDNNQIIVSELYKLNNTNEVKYATYNGDKDKLVPGYWKSRSSNLSQQDIVKDNRSDIRSLQSLLSANKKAKPVSVLIEELTDKSVGKIVKKIDEYNPE